MFFPLVVIVAVLPGLYALSRWDLTPPGPWWGLRSLEVLDGLILDQTPAALEISNPVESRAFRSVVQQPPLHAWLEALALRVRIERDPMATVLPSYVAGALLVILVYLHGILWRGPGVGVVAAVLTAFNHELLVEMQQASPVTLAVAGAASALYAYGRHLRAGSSSAASWNGPEGLLWVVVGGLGLGTSLMSMGLLGLLVIPIVGLHQFYLRAGIPPGERVDRWWLAWRDNVSLLGGGLVLAVALVLALPWHLMMANRHGADFLEALVVPPGLSGRGSPHLLARLIGLAPATVALGLLAAGLAIRDALIAESDDDDTIGGAFWVVWLAVAALTPNLWPTISPEAIDLLILIPLNLLAAQGIAGLANRRIPIRLLNAVAPATAGAIAWSLSGDLRNAVSELAHGRADSTTGLGLHLALDLIIAAVFLTRGIERWARRRDDRQRKVLAVFLISILAYTLADGVSQVTFQQKETRDLLSLRDVILRRNLERPIERVAVIAPDSARAGLEGGRLRFILRSALPHLRPLDLGSTDDLIKRMEAPQGSDWLVVLVGSEQRLSYPIQSQLRLESIYPSGSGLLDAFASTKRAEE